MSRKTTAALEEAAVTALTETLTRLGIDATVLPRERSHPEMSVDVAVEVAGQRFNIETKSVVTAARGEQLARTAKRGVPLLVVADRIAADAKRSLREAGINYFDRRGELRIVSPPLIVDTVVDSTLSMAGRSRGSLDSQVAKEVAIACLLTPDQPNGVRLIARNIDRAPSAVSNTMADLRNDGLLTSAGEAMIPDLFHALLAVWRRRPVPLKTLPPTNPQQAQHLGLGLEDPEHTTGWALTDTLAAASWGIPIVARGDHPPDFYVPSEAAMRLAHSLLGEEQTNPAARACTVALPPARLTCSRRLDHSQTTGERWPVANHIVVALDIAQDRARGLEALEQWKPHGIIRAW